MEKLKSIAVNALVIAIIAITLVWINTWQRQRTQYNRGETARIAGDYTAAISGYEAAIHMYTPGSGTVSKAAEKLWEVGEILERSGDTPRALIAFRSLRSSFLAARGFATPGKDWIHKCDERIAALVHVQARQR